MGRCSMIKVSKLPSQSKLREDFTYNAGTGDFTRYDGKWGTIDKQGYIYFSYEGKSYFTHRLIWKWWYGYDPEQVDHINGDKQDNRIDNLRNVDHITNSRNRIKSKNNSSGFTGVSWNENLSKWKASVRVEKDIYIGVYNSPNKLNSLTFLPVTFLYKSG